MRNETLPSVTCRVDFWDHALMLHVLWAINILFFLAAAHSFKLAIRSIAIRPLPLLQAWWQWGAATVLTLFPERYDHNTHTRIRMLTIAHMAATARTSNGGEPNGRQRD